MMSVKFLVFLLGIILASSQVNANSGCGSITNWRERVDCFGRWWACTFGPNILHHWRCDDVISTTTGPPTQNGRQPITPTTAPTTTTTGSERVVDSCRPRVIRDNRRSLTPISASQKLCCEYNLDVNITCESRAFTEVQTVTETYQVQVGEIICQPRFWIARTHRWRRCPKYETRTRVADKNVTVIQTVKIRTAIPCPSDYLTCCRGFNAVSRTVREERDCEAVTPSPSPPSSTTTPTTTTSTTTTPTTTTPTTTTPTTTRPTTTTPTTPSTAPPSTDTNVVDDCEARLIPVAGRGEFPSGSSGRHCCSYNPGIQVTCEPIEILGLESFILTFQEQVGEEICEPREFMRAFNRFRRCPVFETRTRVSNRNVRQQKFVERREAAICPEEDINCCSNFQSFSHPTIGLNQCVDQELIDLLMDSGL